MFPYKVFIDGKKDLGQSNISAGTETGTEKLPKTSCIVLTNDFVWNGTISLKRSEKVRKFLLCNFLKYFFLKLFLKTSLIF
jgi:hypothetical protein